MAMLRQARTKLQPSVESMLPDPSTLAYTQQNYGGDGGSGGSDLPPNMYPPDNQLPPENETYYPPMPGSMPEYQAPATASPTTAPFSMDQWGSKDPGYIRQLVDNIFGEYGRTPREDEYQQWINYINRDDVSGSGQQLSGWDPYWEMRMRYHAQGDYYGDNPAYDASIGAGGDTLSGQGIDQILQQFQQSSQAAGPSGSTPSMPTPTNATDIRSMLMQLIQSGGQFNPDLVNNRVESARELLEKRRMGELEGQRATLAARGQLGSGLEGDALSRLGERLNTDFGTNVRDIYSDEMERADNRLAEALSLMTGMSIADANNAIQAAGIASDERLGMGRLDLDRTLGLGNLALGNMRAVNDYNLDLGRLGLDRDVSQYNIQGNRDQDIIDLLAQLVGNNR